MGFAQCEWPIWQVDDFSRCFQEDYLQTLLPVLVACLSVAHLVTHGILATVRPKRQYQPLSQDPHFIYHRDFQEGRDGDVAADDGGGLLTGVSRLNAGQALADDDDDDDDEGNNNNENHINNNINNRTSNRVGSLRVGGSRLALVKTTSRGSVVQADTPPTRHVTVIVELLCIASLIVVHALPLVKRDDNVGQEAAIAEVATWAYTFVLVTLRLCFGGTKRRIPRLWNNTTFLYGCQWLFAVILFRSVIIRPPSHLARVLGIINFALVSLLFGIALTTRKGNKTVLLEWEDGIEPSKEPLVSLLSLATFSWVDSIVWKGYWQTMEIKDVWNLLPQDKAAAVLADYRQVKKTTSLAIHLFQYFRGMVLLQCAWAVVSGIVTFFPTLLLKAILEYVQDPTTAPKNVLWLYVILLPLSDVFRSFCDGMALWTGRKICIRIRAIMVGEIFAKALRRKAAAGKDSVLGSSAAKLAAANSEKKGFIARLKQKLGVADRDSEAPVQPQSMGEAAATTASGPAAITATDEQANIGTVINLMSVDSFKVSEITAYLHFLFAAAPTQLVVAVYLLFKVMGLSSIPGMVVMALLLPVNIGFATGFSKTQKMIMAATDKRIHTTNEILQNIRIIKYFAWERKFRNIVDEKRAVELKALRQRFMLWAMAVAVWNSVPVVITFFSFMVYTLVEKKPLYPSVAFTAISLFSLLRHPLDQLGDMIAHVQESKVSIDRVEEFLNEEETEKYQQLGQDNVDEHGNRVIGFRDATFIWGSKTAVAEDGSMAFRLMDLNVDFKIGKLNVIAGPTGSGKSSMLMALLGEMTHIKGRVYLPGAMSREDARPDPESGLTETCAYVAQQAWLVNASVKDNILFAAPFNQQRYKQVVVACALERDFEILDNGDQTLVGERGITLSGGQKQRISLARAVYSNSRHLLLDDCLSAVDSHTAQWIFSNCMQGPLLEGRTCILVSHNIPLCVPFSHHVVLMDNGRVAAQGTPDEIAAMGKLGLDMQKIKASSLKSAVPSRVPSSVGLEPNPATTGIIGGNGGANSACDTKEVRKQAVMDESKAVGAVSWRVISLYLRAMGGWWFWIMTVVIFSFQQLAGVASNVWVKEWANQYTMDPSNSSGATTVYGLSWLSPAPQHVFDSSQVHRPKMMSIPWVSPSPQPNMAATVVGDYGVNTKWYLTILGVIGIASGLSAFMRDIWVFYGSLNASWGIHNRLMYAVTNASFKFFDVTPLGQIMNRFSKDLEAVDQEVAAVAIGVLTCVLGIVVTVVLITAITPGFLIAGVFITLVYVLVGAFYIRASRDLKRLESVQRSPIFQQFGEVLSGVTTIRAYGDERRFIRDNFQRINTQLRPFIYLWACNRWLALRTDIVGDLVSLFAGIFVILTLGKIDAGSVGLSLSYAIAFTESTLWLVRLYASNEQNMNSVERIKEYLDVEQEAAPINEKYRPPPSWPVQGSVEFINYSTRYRADLEAVLNSVSFKVEPREKVGIVGRTGAGKSSLTLAIFRALEATEGKILVDGIDISLIGLQDLREAITMVPQDPTLFTGTIRSNLDPFELYTDAHIFEVLRRVHLLGPDERGATAAASNPGPMETSVTMMGEASSTGTSATAVNKNIFLDLSSVVAESGSNLSQGQRQLLCLARAMLKNSSVLVMDEATASIDYATDAKIQATIRELNNTIITIAHRLQTIIDYDKVLVLDKGRVVQYGHPWDLMQDKKGLFWSMCDVSGELSLLWEAAEKAWKRKNEEAESSGQREGTKTSSPS